MVGRRFLALSSSRQGALGWGPICAALLALLSAPHQPHCKGA